MERLDISKLNKQELLDYKRCIEATIISKCRRMGKTIPFCDILNVGKLLNEINFKLNESRH